MFVESKAGTANRGWTTFMQSVKLLEVALQA